MIRSWFSKEIKFISEVLKIASNARRDVYMQGKFPQINNENSDLLHISRPLTMHIRKRSKYYLPWKFRRSSRKIDDSVCHVYIYPITNIPSRRIDFKRVRQREGCLQLLYLLHKCICNLIGLPKGQPIKIEIFSGSFLATRYQRMMFCCFYATLKMCVI